MIVILIIKMFQEFEIKLLIAYNNRADVNKFPLISGWALKANQKFGKRGVGKRISPEIRVLLEGYFLAGNINKSDRYTAQDMYDELVRSAREGEINMEEVPKVTTIQNWIGRYTREHKQEAAVKELK